MFDNRRVLETYGQDDVTVLRQACRVFTIRYAKEKRLYNMWT